MKEKKIPEIEYCMCRR